MSAPYSVTPVPKPLKHPVAVRRALYAVAVFGALYVVATVVLWTVCLWIFVIHGPYMSSDQCMGLTMGGLLMGVVFGGAGVWAYEEARARVARP